MKTLNLSNSLNGSARIPSAGEDGTWEKWSETHSMPSLCLLKVPSISRYPYVKVSAILRFDNIGSEGGIPLNWKKVVGQFHAKKERNKVLLVPGQAGRSSL